MKTILKIMTVITVTVIAAGSFVNGQTITSQKGLTTAVFSIGPIPVVEITGIAGTVNPGPPQTVFNPGDIIRYTEAISNIPVGAIVSFDIVPALNEPEHPLGLKAVNLVMISAGPVITGSVNGNITIGTNQSYLLTGTGSMSGNISVNGGALVVMGGNVNGNITLGSNSTLICKSGATVSGGSFKISGNGSNTAIALDGCTIEGKLECSGNGFVSVTNCGIHGNLEVLNVSRCIIRNNTVSGQTNTPGCTSHRIGINASESYPAGTLDVFPNPATTEIKIENAESSITSIEIFNTLGEKVYSSAETFQSNVGTSGKSAHRLNGGLETVNVSSLSSGIYFVRVKTSEGMSSGKFIKQ